MIGVRRQLPVHSPLSVGAVAAAIGRGDPRAHLARRLATRHGVRHALLTGSGTQALTLALRLAAERRPGRAIALPGYACYDLASAAVGAGVKVRLYDLDPRTLAPEATSLTAALQGGVAALVIVHLFGVPVPMDAMVTAAQAVDALLIEDAAQGVGGAWRGRPLGGTGDVGILSFGRGKGETGGSGGALLVREDDGLASAAQALLGPPRGVTAVLAAKLAAQWALGRPALFGIPHAVPALRLGETVYRPPEPSSAMPPAAARVLERTLAMSERESAVRREHAARYLSALGPRAARIAVEPAADSRAGWLRFPVRLRPDAARDRLGEVLGIARAYPLPLRELDALRPLLDVPPVTPGADSLARTLRTVPTHSFLTPWEMAGVLDWIAGGEDA